MKIKEIICDILLIKEKDIKDNSRFDDDLGADSLDEVEIIMKIEEYYDIQINDEDAERVKTFSDLKELLKKLGVDSISDS